MSLEALQRSILAERCRQEAIQIREQAEWQQAQDHALLTEREHMQLAAATQAIRQEIAGTGTFDDVYQHTLVQIACHQGRVGT